MRIAVAFFVTAIFAVGASAAEYGLGLSAKSDNGLIYFPIDVSPKFRVEPYARYSTDDTERWEAVPGVPLVTAGDTETLEIGTGLFGVASPHESIRVYYGARAGYVDVENTITFRAGPDMRRDKYSTSGYRVAPTFGFEYIFNAHFTLGGEAAYVYESLDSSDRFRSGSSRSEHERSGTESFLILRYFF